MLRLKQQIEMVSLLFLAAVIGLYLAFNISRNKSQEIIMASNISAVSIQPQDAVQTDANFEPETSTETQISSDGESEVILLIKTNRDGSKNIKISTNSADGQEKAVYNTVLRKDQMMHIPYNTWSPDNKYFFVQQDSPEGMSVMVFRGDGEAFADGGTLLDVTTAFKNKGTEYQFDEATGWASETLIIINTTKPDMTKGASFWYEVPSKAVIQLSSQF